MKLGVCASAVCVAMQPSDVAAVMQIETAAAVVAWTPGNFLDSIAAGHDAELLVEPHTGTLLGYVVAMRGVDALHLLNLTVVPARQGQGYGRYLLDHLVILCRRLGLGQLCLEVRQSNQRALALYLRHGFVQVGLRRNYYPQPQGLVGREDAVVMNLALVKPLCLEADRVE
jgi:[ribosomal protein S18]-alanine N-acetyltransferase